MTSFQVTSQDLEAIAIGGAFLGTGGGGDPYIGKLMAQSVMAEKGPVTVISPDEVADDWLCVPVCMMGAPTVMVEKLPNGSEAASALAQLESFLGRKADALVCIEAGGLNSTIPFAVASATGLPLIDGDGMGRAFPELQMVSFTMHGIAATPMVLADDKGNSSVINAISNLWTERLARCQTVEMGGAALVALYPMSGAQVKQGILRHTISLIREIGETIAGERWAHRNPTEALVSRLKGRRLFAGRVVDIDRRTVGGFARGRATFKGMDAYEGQSFQVDFQNEFLVCRNGEGRLLATTPDLICALDADGGLPVTTEQLRYGLAVTVIGLPCDSQWRTPHGLELVGPHYFGYQHDYIAFEELA
ncbi:MULTISPECIES: DUF917 domain-containing protein [Alphaproteobacteria]|uniref:DUF917 domain-containing protein n=1 Tax=Alphaproteobacteria TaxID=28211 RepID=UPI0004669989|nr:MULTISPECIES: DUF917 domain-containing protein [Alphaproteobacteria]TWH23637.1 hypothetical protein L611_008800000010 [Aminobacter sp. J15]SMG52709.1 hypothetical protein SAMN02746000_03381 [Paracoccus sp. J56]